MTAWSERRYAVVDVEGNGYQPPDLVELAVVPIERGFANLASDVQARLGGAVFVAHNASVDLGVLKRKLPGFAPDDVLDTLRLARRLLPDQPNHRLGSLVSVLDLGRDLPSDLRPHRAGYDALVTARLLVYLASSAASVPLSFEALRDGPGGSDALF